MIISRFFAIVVFGSTIFSCCNTALAQTTTELATRTRPAGDPGLWIGDEDYPAQALEEGNEGKTAFTLAVDADGRVTACTITASSGSQSLDDATCALLSLRARFVPAKDINGQNSADVYSNRIIWQIPEPAPISIANSPKRLKIELEVDEEGAVQSCKVMENNAIGLLGMQGRPVEDACKAIFKSRRPIPIVDAQGQPIRARITNLMEMTIEPIK